MVAVVAVVAMAAMVANDSNGSDGSDGSDPLSVVLVCGCQMAQGMVMYIERGERKCWHVMAHDII